MLKKPREHKARLHQGGTHGLGSASLFFWGCWFSFLEYRLSYCIAASFW